MDNYYIPQENQLTRFVQLHGGEDEIALTLEPDSRLDLYCVEQEGGRRNVVIDLHERAVLNLVTLTLHEGESHLRLHVRLLGEGAEVSLNGAVIGSGTMQSEQDLLVEHCVPGCSSTMLFKQVLGADSRGYLSGRVLVDSGAQQTTSEQTFASLLTSSMARAQALPQLAIYADDVKCNHGATVGKLDEAALFYMRQRGISTKEARMLLMLAFLSEVLDRISLDPLRSRLTGLVELRLRHGQSKCDGCNVCK